MTPVGLAKSKIMNGFQCPKLLWIQVYQPELPRSYVGVARMHALTSDPDQNVPLEMAAFERHEGGLCRTRNFLPVCA
jgi:hypothetical protein